MFVIYIITLNTILVYSFQIAQVATLKWNKIPTKSPHKYFGYDNIFSFNLIIKLPENIGINKEIIKYVEDKL